MSLHLLCRRELPAMFGTTSAFHTTAVPQAQPKRSKKEYKPVVPKNPPFRRDEPPHLGQNIPVIRPKTSFRRMSTQENERDWHNRRGRWATDAEYKKFSGLDLTSSPFKPAKFERIALKWPDIRTMDDAPSYRSKIESVRPSRQNRKNVQSLETFQEEEDITSIPVTTENKKQHKASEKITSVTRPIRESAQNSTFSDFPLMPGILSCLKDLVGPDAVPTPIQQLSLQHILEDLVTNKTNTSEWSQFLLASETGSGKSIAYLLPMLQALKQAEIDGNFPTSDTPSPRALILAPTHELARQLSAFAKALVHLAKLRVVCTSRANDNKTTSFVGNRSMDVLVGTPMKLLEMLKGRGWNHNSEEDEDVDAPNNAVLNHIPEISLQNVQWVIVDEADVLFDPDFNRSTSTLLNDTATAIRKARNTPEGVLPFHLVLSSATIPDALNKSLAEQFPTMTRLLSRGLHQLPSTLDHEYVNWTSGNKFADVERQLRKVWQEEWKQARLSGETADQKSKVLIFCNKNFKVDALGQFLEEKGIHNVSLTSTGGTRHYGSNKHIQSFLKPVVATSKTDDPLQAIDNEEVELQLLSKSDQATDTEGSTPHVLITTSLLSRGLDFSPDIRNVFILDEPRNMVDFLHRAGRTGRAGESGKVVIFGKGIDKRNTFGGRHFYGKAADRAKEVRSSINRLTPSKNIMRASA